MSNNRLYNCYKKIVSCSLVKVKEINNETLEEFEKLLNSTIPENADETSKQSFCRYMYYSNPIGFVKYISYHKNRVSSLVLWTESKNIVRHFGLQRLVHITWNKEDVKYVVSKYNPDLRKSSH
jgi:hypothetical protein